MNGVGYKDWDCLYIRGKQAYILEKEIMRYE